MAKKRASSVRTVVVRAKAPARRGTSPLVAKLKKRLAAAHKRARSDGGYKQMSRDGIAAAGAAALGYGEQKGIVPQRIGPIDSALIVGALGAFILPRFVKGKVGAVVHDVTLGALCVGTYRLGSGAPIMGAEMEGSGGWG